MASLVRNDQSGWMNKLLAILGAAPDDKTIAATQSSLDSISKNALISASDNTSEGAVFVRNSGGLKTLKFLQTTMYKSDISPSYQHYYTKARLNVYCILLSLSEAGDVGHTLVWSGVCQDISRDVLNCNKDIATTEVRLILMFKSAIYFKVFHPMTLEHSITGLLILYLVSNSVKR